MKDSVHSHMRDNWQTMWKRRGQTPGMEDYLTLEQLENVWYKQDFYVGCMSLPQVVTQYTFTEAVEVPLIAEHNPDTRQHREPRPPPDLDSPLPPIPGQNASTCIDGAIHPALRPNPYLNDSPALTPPVLPPGRLAVAVPDTNWTYGRD